jgi:hypothetical protein
MCFAKLLASPMPSKFVSVSWWIQLITSVVHILIQYMILTWQTEEIEDRGGEWEDFMWNLWSGDLICATIALTTILNVTDMFRQFLYRLAAMAKSLVGMMVLGVIFVIAYNHVWWFSNFEIWEAKNIKKFDMKLNLIQTVDTMFNHWNSFVAVNYQTNYFHMFFLVSTMLGLNLVITKFMIAFVVAALNDSNADGVMAGQLTKLQHIVEGFEMQRLFKGLKKNPKFFDEAEDKYSDFELDHVFDVCPPVKGRYGDATWTDRTSSGGLVHDANDKYIYVVSEKIDAAISKEKADATRTWRAKIEQKVDIIKNKVELMEVTYDVNENKLVDFLREVKG